MTEGEQILAVLPTGVIRAHAGGRCTYANPAALGILQADEAELIGHTLAELGYVFRDESGADVTALHDAQRATLHVARGVVLDVWIELDGAALRSDAGEPSFVLSFSDVTERVRRRAVERASVEQTGELLRSMAAGVLLVDAEGRIEYANPAAAALSGLKPEDVIGQLAADPAWQLTDANGQALPYDALPVPTALRERREVRGVELGLPTLNGARWMRVSAFPLFAPDGTSRGAVVTTEDITERHALAEQLLQAQKIDAIGQLAGGIAHDFNNLLTVIVGNAELALRIVAKSSAAVREISEIRDAANRGAALTRQMLTFARKQVVQPRAVHLDHLIASIDRLLHRALGEEISLHYESARDLWFVKVDPGQMEQVILNMALNARDAMPRGGSVVIEASNATLEASEVQGQPGVAPGEYVRLSIRDTGLGMSRDVAARIFEPFFTTKPTGSGTGLGLSICHGVVKQARGFISVDTAPDRGTTFHIYLPRTQLQLSYPAPARQPAVVKGQGRILLVEDQDDVRSLVARTLAGYGYDVVAAMSGSQALRLYEQHGGGFDLLLTDVVMPEMRGIELARALQAREPNLPVLFMTGYLDVGSADIGELNVDENVLLKPFTPMQLVQRIERVRR